MRDRNQGGGNPSLTLNLNERKCLMIKIDMSDNNESLEVTFRNGVTIQIDQTFGAVCGTDCSTGVVVKATSFKSEDYFNVLGNVPPSEEKFLNPNGENGFIYIREKV
jgi:hypothetical protein